MLFIQRAITFHQKGERASSTWDSHHFTLFLSLLPREVSWCLKHVSGQIYLVRERERDPEPGTLLSPKFHSACITSPLLSARHPLTLTLTQPAEKFGANSWLTWDSRHPVTRSVCKEIREFRFMNHKRSLGCIMPCLIQNMFSVLPRWFSASSHDNLIINYKLHWKMRLHNKPGILCCHLFFLNSYFCWLHNNPLIRYDVKYQMVQFGSAITNTRRNRTLHVKASM